MKRFIIITNIIISLSLAVTGMTRMIMRDPLLGRGYEWSTAIWILGVISLFLVPLEICVIKPRNKS